jgi:DNA topoisomerase-1
MKDSNGTRIAVSVTCGDAEFRASGKTILFAGYLRAYVEGADDPEAELADKEKILPPLKVGETLKGLSFDALSHETQPPARFTEGSLIKELERLGIGRPSTWATIVDVVLSRDYAFKKGTSLVPTFLALGVTQLMERYFTRLLDYKFTANLEDDLDSIAMGKADNLSYLKNFYFGGEFPGLEALVKTGEETIDPREINGIPLGKHGELAVEVRVGRYGPFISDGTNRASVPDAFCPDELTIEKALELLETAKKGPASLGKDPTTNEKVYLKTGRFGPYVQRGEMVEDGPKPKMVSLLPGMTPDTVTLETALKLLELPKNIGAHPQLGADIIVSAGRFGPYLKCGEETRSIPLDEVSPIAMTVEKAVEILARPRTRGRGKPAQPTTLRELGKHTVSQLTLVIKSGRYGPYVTDGSINATIPKGEDPATLTLERAVNLIDERAAKGPVKKKRSRSTKKSKSS